MVNAKICILTMSQISQNEKVLRVACKNMLIAYTGNGFQHKTFLKTDKSERDNAWHKFTQNILEVSHKTLI